MSSFCKHCFSFHNFFLISSLNSLLVSSFHPFHFLNNWLVPLDTNLLTSTNSIMWFTPSARLKLSGYLSAFSPILVLHVYMLAYWVTISQDFHCPTRPTAPSYFACVFLIGCQQLKKPISPPNEVTTGRVLSIACVLRDCMSPSLHSLPRVSSAAVFAIVCYVPLFHVPAYQFQFATFCCRSQV